MKITDLLLVLCLAGVVGCNRDRAMLPDELVGTWTTEEPVYQGRSLKLEKEFILVGFGQDVTPAVQRITKVETLHTPTGETATVYSADKEGPHELTIYFDPTDGGTVVLKNVRGRWHRRATA